MPISFERELTLKTGKSSAFLFGPRMTGKTTLLKALKPAYYLDLLDPEIELKFRESPKIFWEEIQALKPGSLVVVDEIQRIPVLLDYVQMGIDRMRHRFILSGSSARKLKRGGANLLGGRALHFRLHPLTVGEIGNSFHIEKALQFGTLPKIYSLVHDKEEIEARRFLRSYVTTYIKEEIQAEAITRNIGAFQRFLSIAAQSNAQVIEFANISRECSVPMSTVKEYYQILEDTLLGEFLWPYDRSERKKARPKFYFFDCGVVRALQNQLNDPPIPVQKGVLFETWMVRELIRMRDYQEKEDEFGLWREGLHEIDLVVVRQGKICLAIECKSGRSNPDLTSVRFFHRKYPGVPLIISSLVDDRRRHLEEGIDILPWQAVLGTYHYL